MKACYICTKQSAVGNKVSHSQRKTKRKFGANLHKIKISGKKKLICSGCLKRMKNLSK